MELNRDERAKLIRALELARAARFVDPGGTMRDTQASRGDDQGANTLPSDVSVVDAQLEPAVTDDDQFVLLSHHLQAGGDLDLTDGQVRETVRDAMEHSEGAEASPQQLGRVTIAVEEAERGVASQEFLDRVSRVADEAVEVHAESDRPIEQVFTELAARDGIITAQGNVETGPRAEHIARLEAVARQLDQAIHQMHEHDPQAVIEGNSPESVALAIQTQEIPAQSAPSVSGLRPGEPHSLQSEPAVPAERAEALHR